MQGKYLCAAIQFEVAGQLPNLYQCYCSLYQKQTGGSHNIATLVDEASFSWIKCQHTINDYQKDTGFSAHHCPHCGSPVPNLLRGTGKYWIPAGLLEGPILSKVILHLHLNSKPAWQDLP